MFTNCDIMQLRETIYWKWIKESKNKEKKEQLKRELVNEILNHLILLKN